MLEVSHVSKKYGMQLVLDDVSLSLPKGEIIAFIGANGAGKSTLLNIMSRLLEKNGGKVLVDGKEVTDWKSAELSRRLSVLGQSNHFNIRLTIRELVAFGRFPYTQGRLTEEDERIIDQALDYMGIADIQHKMIDELSGGQQQMAYIAMIIAQDTEYILLDEPLNNLDMKKSVTMMRILEKLVRDFQKTILLVVHDINFVSHYADYVVAFKDGKILKAGGQEEMITSDMLSDIYGMDINIEVINEQKVCVYFK